VGEKKLRTIRKGQHEKGGWGDVTERGEVRSRRTETHAFNPVVGCGGDKRKREAILGAAWKGVKEMGEGQMARGGEGMTWDLDHMLSGLCQATARTPNGKPEGKPPKKVVVR